MTTKRIVRSYVLLNGVNDVAYFCFLTLQFLLLEPVLRALLPENQATMSIGLTMTLITSQLVWQVFAEAPTGALADCYGRAWAVAMSFWCRLAAVVLVIACVLAGPYVWSSALAVGAVVVALILAQVLTATGEAFLEGSIEAWVRDECEAAAPDCYKEAVNEAFEQSALVQNVAILGTVTASLFVWQESGYRGGIALAGAAGCLFLAGALVSHNLSAQEAYEGASGAKAAPSFGSLRGHLREGGAVAGKLREAFTAVVNSDERGVRRLITVFVLPFPCWIMLSWFFTAFARPGAADAAASPVTYALWLGLTLGVARVLGAWIGRHLSRCDDEKHLHVVFERSVLVNVCFLFGAALILALRNLFWGGASSTLAVILFLLSVALAKGSEEVIKLSKNKFLASALPNADVRATTLSLVSVAQNAFGFVAISLSALLAFMLTSSDTNQPVIIFTVCAATGVVGWLKFRGV